jgi:DNA-binding transcriptional ArsR family regulator
MLIIRFGRTDLANVRFAISPLFEVHRSVRALENPAARALHLPWIRFAQAQERVSAEDLALLRALQPVDVYTPDFIHPPPSSPLARIDDELDEMLSTPARRVREEIRFAYRDLPLPDVLLPFLKDPAAAVAGLAEIIRNYWRVLLEPHWGRLRMVLEGDVLYRAREIADGGETLLFSDLHPEAWFEEGTLHVEKPWHDEISLDGRGLLLVPSAFVWPLLSAITEAPWQPTLIYPARGLGMLWEPGAPVSSKALAALLGRRRAAVLTALDSPRSTTEVAQRLGLSPASVSQHLAVLRRAGLVHANRVKRVVLYARTSRGDSLLEGT